MKTRILTILLAIVVTASADQAKQMAYGPVNFGDSLEQAQQGMQKITEDMNRRRLLAPDARELVRDFVVKGTKYPPKLSQKYHATVASVVFTKTAPVTEVQAQTNSVPAADYATKIRPDWEVLQDIASSKFGQQKTKSDFPAVPDTKEVVTDVWQYAGMEISLIVKPWPAQGGGLKYSVILRASRQ